MTNEIAASSVRFALLGRVAHYSQYANRYEEEEHMGFISEHDWSMSDEVLVTVVGRVYSVPLPVGVLVLKAAKTSYVWLYDPCDPEIRAALQERRECGFLPLLFRDPQGSHAYVEVRPPILDVPLDETIGIEPAAPWDWIDCAKQFAKEVPRILAESGEASERYSVRIVVPDDVNHTMHSSVVAGAMLGFVIQ